jgi:hypothetical protein
MLIPSVLAVCRLMTNSNLTGRITGKSESFSPLRIRPLLGRPRFEERIAPMSMRKTLQSAVAAAMLALAVGLAMPASAQQADLGAIIRFAPVISELQAAGVTSLRGIAAALNERGIPTTRGGERPCLV